MARARNIKPGFFTNDGLAELPFEYRLLYIGLWTLADREGRLEDRPKKIRMAIFPADDVDCDLGIEALQAAGFLVRYVVNGVRLIDIPAFKDHQSPHHKEHASTIPPRVQVSSTSVEPEACATLQEGEARGESETEGGCEGGSTALIADTGYRIPESIKKPPAKKSTAEPVYPDWLDGDAWSRWHDFRRAKSGKAWTADARRLSIATLTRFHEAGHDPTSIIDRSIERGWTGLFAPDTAGGNGAPTDDWWRSDSGITRKAREVGVSDAGCRTYAELKDRVVAKLKETAHAA